MTKYENARIWTLKGFANKTNHRIEELSDRNERNEKKYNLNQIRDSQSWLKGTYTLAELRIYFSKYNLEIKSEV